MRYLLLFFLTLGAIEASLPRLSDTIIPHFWYYLGPFPVAPREGITGIDEEEIKFSPDTTKTYLSIFTEKGEVKWQRITTDSLNLVNIEYKEILWDTFISFYGFSLISSLTYFWTEVEVETSYLAKVLVEKVSSFTLNGLSYPGDPYGHGFFHPPVSLRKGKNSILLKVSGFPPHRFKFALLPVKSEIEIIVKDITSPTLIPKESQSVLIGIPIANNNEQAKKDLKLRLWGEGIKEVVTNFSLLPQLIKKIPVELTLRPEKEGKVLVYAEVEEKNFILTVDSFNLEVKERDSVQRITFISGIDSSVQYFALRYPKEYLRDKKYSLILSLHGAGVEAYNQARSYSPKDWAFIACPTNRRPYGFDWQDWGRLDALEVIEYMKSKFPIDTNRIYLTGHSMGGHGVWHIGLLYPSLFAAIAPGAGWPSHQLYCPWTFQRSEIFAERPILTIRDRVLRIDNPLNLLDNALNLPIFIFHGALDDNVPTLFARMFASHLKTLGYHYHYKEVPGKRHWYYLDTTNIVCVDDPEIMEFLKKEERNPFPEKVIFKTSDLDITNQAYWLNLLELEREHLTGKIAGEIKGETIVLNTENIKAFKITLPPKFFFLPEIILKINGVVKKIRSKPKASPTLIFEKRPGGLFFLTNKRPRPRIRGPMRKAYFSPFLLVYGTKSDTAAKITYHLAKREALTFWRIGNGRCAVLPDTAIGEEEIERYNLIIFGGKTHNYLSERMEKRLPIKERVDKLFFFNKELGGDLSYRYIYPNPLNPKRFLLLSGGTSLKNLTLSTFFSTLHSAAGLPDFILFSPEVTKKGWGGVLATGFFDKDWRFSPIDSYIKP